MIFSLSLFYCVCSTAFCIVLVVLLFFRYFHFFQTVHLLFVLYIYTIYTNCHNCVWPQPLCTNSWSSTNALVGITLIHTLNFYFSVIIFLFFVLTAHTKRTHTHTNWKLIWDGVTKRKFAVYNFSNTLTRLKHNYHMKDVPAQPQKHETLFASKKVLYFFHKTFSKIALNALCT